MEQKTASKPIKTFQSKYLLDANCFINLERFYPHGIFRSLDDTIKKNIELKNIQTIEAIYTEAGSSITNILNRYNLIKNKLVLNDSSNFNDDVLFYVNEKIKELADHYNEELSAIEKENKDFLGSGNNGKNILGPDGLLIAKAKDMGRTVVTEEKSKGPMAKKIKIPNVCEQFDVKCINFLELLRTENVKF